MLHPYGTLFDSTTLVRHSLHPTPPAFLSDSKFVEQKVYTLSVRRAERHGLGARIKSVLAARTKNPYIFTLCDGDVRETNYQTIMTVWEKAAG